MAHKQIEQMVNFIMQEAHEKVNEIRLKTDHDFNLEKQMLVHSGKLRIQEEYTQKEKDFEIRQRVEKSSAVGTARVKKMKARDDRLVDLRAESATALTAVASTSKYSSILKNLIVQGLTRLNEPTVSIHCRQSDIAKVKAVLPEAVNAYKTTMTSAGHRGVNVTVVVNEDAAKCLSARSAGGVILTALNGRITCDNSLDARLKIAYDQMLPRVRAELFPAV